MKLELNHHEVAKIRIACTIIANGDYDEETKKFWQNLHDKIAKQAQEEHEKVINGFYD